MKLKILISALFVIVLVTTIILLLKKENTNSYLKPHFPSSDADYYQADSLTGHFHKPHVIREFEWKEHLSGKIIMKTNNVGLRSDTDTEIIKTENLFRVLITGDSHIDGVLNNNESIAYSLEYGLNYLYPARKHEALNAGNGYFGPQNYLGAYNKFQNYNPDVFVVIIYTGNDFLDAIRIEAENGRLNVPDRPNGYYDKLWEIDELYTGFTGQQLNQLKFFETYPDFTDTALIITQQSLLKIKKLCKRNHTSFLVVLLPTKIDTEPQTDKSRIDEVFEIMGFNASHLQKNREMVLSLAEWLEQNDVTYIDLGESFKKSDGELFWQADYHINVAGHKAIADKILSSGFIN